MTTVVSVIGLGYIGLPTACIIANNSNSVQVHGFDINKNVIASIRQGIAPFSEPGLNDALTKALEKGLTVGTALTPADVYIICVPTPFKEDGRHSPDLSYVKAAAEAIAACPPRNCLVIVESTSPVGTTELVQSIVQRSYGEAVRVAAAYCPERGIPGNTLHEIQFNDRILGGITEQDTQSAVSFYSLFIRGQLHPTSAATAEMCKLTENSFRDVNIAFANEIAKLAELSGVDVIELIKLANKHPRVNILQPGIGVGGHCIPVDPWFLIAAAPSHSNLLQQARAVNLAATDRVIESASHAITELVKRQNHDAPSNVVIWGLSFKPDIDDFRESPAFEIWEKLVKKHKGTVKFSVVEPFCASRESSDLPLISPESAVGTEGLHVLLVGHSLFTPHIPHLKRLCLEGRVLDYCHFLTR